MSKRPTPEQVSEMLKQVSDPTTRLAAESMIKNMLLLGDELPEFMQKGNRRFMVAFVGNEIDILTCGKISPAAGEKVILSILNSFPDFAPRILMNVGKIVLGGETGIKKSTSAADLKPDPNSHTHN